MDDIMIVPSALIQCSGMDILTLTETTLYWNLVGLIQDDKNIVNDGNGIVLKVPAKLLLAKGEVSYGNLLNRLDRISDVSIRCNLDARDDSKDLWKVSLRLLTEYEYKGRGDGFLYLNIGIRFYNALKNREIYAKIRQSALFSMNKCKYSSRLYLLIRDKINQKHNFWVVSVEELRERLQIKGGSYTDFNNFKLKILDKCFKEINSISELDVSWFKSNIVSNRITDITIEWKIKNIPNIKAVDRRLTYSKVGRDIIADRIVSPLVLKAENYLLGSDISTRIKWSEISISQCGVQKTMAMCSKDNIPNWINEEVAMLMKEEGLI